MRKGNTIFINDSKATSFEATKYALSSLKKIYIGYLEDYQKKGDKIILSKNKKILLNVI